MCKCFSFLKRKEKDVKPKTRGRIWKIQPGNNFDKIAQTNSFYIDCSYKNSCHIEDSHSR